mmetsp:Transcript_77390/g.226958  ORF Transcript_77390/g.226958 Transcript_77390/m.226958 type:complete len:200 (+) Transcript_77390:254-853(+)
MLDSGLQPGWGPTGQASERNRLLSLLGMRQCASVLQRDLWSESLVMTAPWRYRARPVHSAARTGRWPSGLWRRVTRLLPSELRDLSPWTWRRQVALYAPRHQLHQQVAGRPIVLSMKWTSQRLSTPFFRGLCTVYAGKSITSLISTCIIGAPSRGSARRRCLTTRARSTRLSSGSSRASGGTTAAVQGSARAEWSARAG